MTNDIDMDNKPLVPQQRTLSLEQMAKNSGHSLWASWQYSASVYVARLNIPLEERQTWINTYLSKRYFTWEEYEQPRKSGR